MFISSVQNQLVTNNGCTQIHVIWGDTGERGRRGGGDGWKVYCTTLVFILIVFNLRGRLLIDCWVIVLM